MYKFPCCNILHALFIELEGRVDILEQPPADVLFVLLAT